MTCLLKNCVRGTRERERTLDARLLVGAVESFEKINGGIKQEERESSWGNEKRKGRRKRACKQKIIN